MAAGITQPAGNGGALLFEDDAHADAGGDGSYSFADIYAKVVASGFKAADGVTQAVERWIGAWTIYWFHVALTNGDGSGTAVTTLKDKRTVILFDTGKVYSVSTTGRSNRWTEFGRLVGDGEQLGVEGVLMVQGGSGTITGNMKIYDSKIVAITSTMQLVPATVGLFSELFDTKIVAETGQSGFGSATTPINKVRRVALNFGATTGALNCASDDMVDVNIAGTGGSFLYFINTGSVVLGKLIRFFGQAGTSVLRSTSVVAAWKLVNTVFPSLGAGDTNSHPLPVEQWSQFNTMVISPAGTPLAGRRVRLKDVANAVVATGVTDATGRISYGSGTTGNAVRVRWRSTGAWVEDGPFTLEVNPSDAAEYVAAEESVSIVIDWPYIQHVEKSLEPILEIVKLGPPVSVLTPAPTVSVDFLGVGHIPAMLTAIGQPITLGATTTRCLLDRETEERLEGWSCHVSTDMIVASIQTGTLAAAIGQAVSTDAHTYYIRDIRTLDDGAMTALLLAEDPA